MWDDRVYIELTLEQAEAFIKKMMDDPDFEGRIEGHDIDGLQVVRIIEEEQ